MLGAGLLWRHTTDDFRVVVERLFRMERALFAGETLHNDFCVGVQLQVAARRFVRAEANIGGQTHRVWNGKWLG